MRPKDGESQTRALMRILVQLALGWGRGMQLLLVAGVTLVLMALVLRSLSIQTPQELTAIQTERSQNDVAVETVVTAPAVDESLPESRVPPPGTALLGPTADVSVIKTATTQSGDDAIVFNGERITYTITISNDTTINDVLIVDALPEGTLSDVQCAGCIKQFDVMTIPEPLGGVVVVTVTTKVNWEIASLAPGRAQRTFSAQVTGQSDGTVFRNQAFVLYNQNQTANSNEVATTARVRVETYGAVSVSSAPTWFSADRGGTLSMDWGDFDADGDLDLALGSSLGATIYQNDRGALTLLRGDHDDSSRQAYGVRWADFDNDAGRRLELVVVGKSVDGTAATEGTNYVYRWNGDDYFQQTDVFTSEFQLVRVAPGDFDGDGDLDLVVSTNGINPPCPVRFYRNSSNAGDLFHGPGQCVSTDATASFGPGDFDNDGDLDLALGLFPDAVKLYINKSDVLTATSPFTDPLLIDTSLSFLPYDFSWGDYDGDGYLDLGAAYPLERRIRVYANPAAGTINPATPWSYTEIRSESFMTPLSIGWGDFDGDGRLDLATAGSPPKVYRYDNTAPVSPWVQIRSLSPDPHVGQTWSMPLADFDSDGDLDLTLSNRDGPSLLFTTFAPFLKSAMDGIGSWNAGSVAWGDLNGDAYLDLVYGAGRGDADTQRYYNDKQGGFARESPNFPSGFGPQSVAIGDINGDGDLDLAVSTLGTDKVYLAGSTVAVWTSSTSYPSNDVAWGDADDDGDLDLLVANDGPNFLFVNQNGQLGAAPVWTSTVQVNTRAIAWADYDGDRYLDFAAGNYDQPTRVYRNNQDNSFSAVFTSSAAFKTTSVAWADWDGDGDLDLALGNDGEANSIFGNVGGVLQQEPVWTPTELNKTTSLAWGDWDNDGDLDLAVGNDGQPDQVYANLSTPSAPQLAWLWTSQESLQTTGVAWGDRDRDGDLDLAISQGGGGSNGFYENTYVMPSHLTTAFDEMTPLPNNPSYLSIERPGRTDDAYFFSSAELLPDLSEDRLTIEYTLFDPDPNGVRDKDLIDPARPGDAILDTKYEFSIDGGGTWRPATGEPSPSPVLTTTRGGYSALFRWDAVADAAISDDARFRITIVQQNRNGPFQRASMSAVSPPFRVRGLECVWPANPSITPSQPRLNAPMTFQGGLAVGSGVLTFTWNFDDGSPLVRGQVVQHTFARPGVYDVRLAVTSEPCPIAKQVFTSARIVIGGRELLLPLVVKSARASQSSGAVAEPDARPPQEELAPDSVTGLWGLVQIEDGTTHLGWRLVDSKKKEVTGYRVYRRAAQGQGPFRLLATVPADVGTYVDETASCGQNYYVTAFNDAGESPSSAASYFSPPCQ